jgi:hypothetical protein
MARKAAHPPARRRTASRTIGGPSGGEAARRESALALQKAMESVAAQLHRDRGLRPGAIVFRATVSEPPVFALRSTESAYQIDTVASDPTEPLLEVIGDPRRIRAIVMGEKDARMQFFAGGIRVRGDMHYLSELGMRLGFLKKPIV